MLLLLLRRIDCGETTAASHVLVFDVLERICERVGRERGGCSV